MFVTELLRPCGMVSRGLYADMTRAWVSVFGRHRTLVVRHADLLHDTASTLRRIFRFVGVDAELCDPFPHTAAQNLSARGRARVVRQWFAQYRRPSGGHLRPRQLRALLERERYLHAVCSTRIGRDVCPAPIALTLTLNPHPHIYPHPHPRPRPHRHLHPRVCRADMRHHKATQRHNSREILSTGARHFLPWGSLTARLSLFYGFEPRMAHTLACLRSACTLGVRLFVCYSVFCRCDSDQEREMDKLERRFDLGHLKASPDPPPDPVGEYVVEKWRFVHGAKQCVGLCPLTA